MEEFRHDARIQARRPGRCVKSGKKLRNLLLSIWASFNLRMIGIILKGLFLDERMATSRIWFNGRALPETCMVTRTFSQQGERESFDKEDFFLKREWNEDARFNLLAKKD